MWKQVQAEEEERERDVRAERADRSAHGPAVDAGGTGARVRPYHDHSPLLTDSITGGMYGAPSILGTDPCASSPMNTRLQFENGGTGRADPRRGAPARRFPDLRAALP